MAEAIAIGASVIAIIQITDRIVGLCKFYIENVKDAPSDLRAILLETSTLKTIFENLKFLSACDGSYSTMASSLSGADGPIEGCLQSVTELEELFPSDSVHLKGQSRSKKRKLKSTLASLAWPLKETKARKLLDKIACYKSTINLALITESIQDVKEIKTKTSEIYDVLTESQRQELYRWLQHTDPSPLHHRAQKNYEPGTGKWMLRTPEWKSWLEAKDRFLWIHGIPGAGKTVLMSQLIEQLRNHCDQSAQGETNYVYYYCYFAHNQDETTPFLKWLISQLCRKAEHIPAVVNKIYNDGREPSLVDLLNMLACILEKFKVVYVAVDALDESDPREDFLKVLRDFVTDSRFNCLQVIASSREYIDIEKSMAVLSASVSMNNPFVEEDIRCHVRSILQSCPQFKRWPHELLREVEEAVATGAKGMFRWAVCQIDVLRRLKCDRSIVKKTLNNLPRTLDETYDRILNAIPEDERLFVHHMLRWIAHHNELYKGEGIPCEILVQAAEVSTLKLARERNERFYDKDMLREVCGCLLDLSLEECRDQVRHNHHTYTSVKFAHYTVREYLDSARLSNTALAYLTVSVENLREHFVEITLSEAQYVEESKIWESRNAHPGDIDIIGEIHSNFTDYCVISAVLSLLHWPRQICQQDALGALTIDLLDPSKPYVEAIALAYSTSERVGNDILGNFDQEIRFWDVQWYSETSGEARHLYYMLFLTQIDRELVPLATSFLLERDRKGLLQRRLRFEKEIVDGFCPGEEIYMFDGSPIEIFAQLGTIMPDAFKFLIEVGAGLFDPSTALLLFIGGHEHRVRQTCKEYCLLERLLDLGANPNLEDHRVTPLQIATCLWDLKGVSALLKAGARPNYAGNDEGIAWRKDTLMSAFNYLHGANPLRICRNEEDDGMYWKREERHEERVKVEALLLRHGAEENT